MVTVKVTKVISWRVWSAEYESEFYRLVSDVAKKFKKRPRVKSITAGVLSLEADFVPRDRSEARRIENSLVKLSEARSFRVRVYGV